MAKKVFQLIFLMDWIKTDDLHNSLKDILEISTFKRIVQRHENTFQIILTSREPSFITMRPMFFLNSLHECPVRTKGDKTFKAANVTL